VNCFWKSILVLAVIALPTLGVVAQSPEDYDLPPVNYSATQPHDIVSRLQTRVAAGDLKFAGSDKEIIRQLLRELRIPIESQLLVFSKTSLQRARIRPDCPRALYFSDTCYVGWVPGGLAEVASIDSTNGPIFYSFDPRPEASPRQFTRDPDCMRCHGGTFVPRIPAVFARSLFADDDGEPLLRQGSQVVDYCTPFAERWGGWYVTGRHGTAVHRGNTFAAEKDGALVVDFTSGANITNLSPFFDTAKYLSEGSDIVALLVFEHQLTVHNAITHAGFSCRRMLDYQKNLQIAFKEPVTEGLAYDSVKTVFNSSARDVVDCLLFKDEAKLPDGIEGNAKFPGAFQVGAPRAADGTSLKDLDLKTHLFKNRCSYLIYSESFMALPEILKRQIYVRLAGALNPVKPDPSYAYIGSEERARIRQILRQTHPDLRRFWSTEVLQ
jgi:hypothetical protein